MSSWPDFEPQVESFFSTHLYRPRKLFAAFVPSQRGSGRPPGPRDLYWPTVVSLSVASLEAGLEDIIFAAHGVRMGGEGDLIRSEVNAPDRNPRGWLVEERLMTPNARKLERVLFADFGLMLGDLPEESRFTAMKKEVALGGAGRGVPTTSPSTWRELRTYFEALSHIRNATAHGDVRKLGSSPPAAEGLLWVKQKSGPWSVQMPHALTALRATLAIFNAVAEGLGDTLGRTDLRLVSPDSIRYPDGGGR